MKRVLAILGALILCGAAATGYYQRWEPATSLTSTKPGQVLFDRELIEFEPTTVGTPSAARLIVSNRGDQPVQLAFQNQGGQFRAPKNLIDIKPRRAAEIQLEFGAERFGAFDGSMIVESKAFPNGAKELHLRAVAHAAPELVIEPRAVDFGAVAIGETRTATIQFHNRGDGELEVFGLSKSDPFAFLGSGFRVAPRSSEQIEVQFAPERPGETSRQLTVRSNDTRVERFGVEMKGEGVEQAPNPSIWVTPEVLSFGTVAPGRSARRWIEIENRGKDPLTISSIVVGTPFRTSTRSRRVAPRGVFRLPVTFQPSRAGVRSLESLAIHSNDAESGPVLITLEGEAVSAVVLEQVADGVGTSRSSIAGSDGSGAGPNAVDAATNGEGAPDRLTDNPAIAPNETAQEGAAAAGSYDVLEEGSQISLASHLQEVSSANVREVAWDAEAGTVSLEGLQLPTVGTGLGEFYAFDEANIVGRVDEAGEVSATVPIRMVDDDGNETVINLDLTTDTATTYLSSGVEFAVSGSAMTQDGAMTLVGMQRIRSGRLEGHLWKVVLNVRAR